MNKIDVMTNGNLSRKQLKELSSKNPEIPDIASLPIIDVGEIQKYIRKKRKEKEKIIAKMLKESEVGKVQSRPKELPQIVESTPRCSDTLRRKTFRTVRADVINMSLDISAIFPVGNSQ